MSKPRPVPENEVCSECGEDWSLHPENPRRRDCIELLRDRPVTSPIIWWNQNPHYCNWGHANCHIVHYYPNQWYSTGAESTHTGIGLGLAKTTSIVSGNTIDDDDPDMGVQAKVS